MEGLFKNKYRIDSTRLKGWNYSSDGFYFVTICTKNKWYYFGDIENNKMILSNIGQVAEKCWVNIPNHFFNIELDEFVIMPNHVHGIIVINNKVETQNLASKNTETQNLASLRENYNKFGPQSRNLASVIRGFKIGVTKYCVENKFDFAWQPRFYDHIINKNADLETIRDYIKNNPLMWQRDRNNLAKLKNIIQKNDLS